VIYGSFALVALVIFSLEAGTTQRVAGAKPGAGPLELPEPSIAAFAPARPGQAIPAERNTIKVDVTLVTVPVMVTDRNGKYIAGLEEADFHIFEDGVAQKIDRLIPASEPFNIALMMDSSGSTRFKYEEIQNAALRFVESLRSQDRLMIVCFDTKVSLHSELTENRAALRAAILATRSSQSETHLYDALDQVITRQFSRLSGRKAIVLFTDGVDNVSINFGPKETLERVQKSDVLVYAIQYDTRQDGMPDRFRIPPPQGQVSFNSLYNRAVKFLRDLSAHSGGRHYRTETLLNLNEAFTQIAEELPRQYSLCYYPARQARDGSYRRIRVTVDHPGARVRARTGYRATAKPAAGK
jgi:Ca-activated chloride channel family protein